LSVRLVRIRGLLFFSGFVRKELIIENALQKNRRRIFIFFFSFLMSITMAYRIKLIILGCFVSKETIKIERSQQRLVRKIILVFLRIFVGN